MITKVPPRLKGSRSSYIGLVRYLLDPKNKLERVKGSAVTNCQSDEPLVAALEVVNVQQLNQRSQDDKTYHFLFSFRAGERPDALVLADCEQQLCQALGFAEHQRVSVVHDDTNNLHVHVAVNKVHPTRHTIHTPYRDYRIQAQACALLEAKHGLLADNHEPQRNAAPRGRAADMERQSGLESFASWIQRVAAADLRGASTWVHLHRAAKRHGLTLVLRGNGCVFSDGNHHVRASAVGREFALSALQGRLGEFQPVALGAAQTPKVSTDRQATASTLLKLSHPSADRVQPQRSRARSSAAVGGALPPPRVLGRQRPLTELLGSAQERMTPEEQQRRTDDWARVIAELEQATRATATPAASARTAPNQTRRRPPPEARGRLRPLSEVIGNAEDRMTPEEQQQRMDDWSRILAELAQAEVTRSRAELTACVAALARASDSWAARRLELAGEGFAMATAAAHAEWLTQQRLLERAIAKAAREVATAEHLQDVNSEHYAPRPLAAAVDTRSLYRQYLADQQARSALSAQRRGEQRAEANREFEKIMRAARFRRAIVKLSSAGPGAKRLMYASIHWAAKTEIKELRRRQAFQREVSITADRRLTWAAWLQERARTGDAGALAVLRSRQDGKPNARETDCGIISGAKKTAAGTADAPLGAVDSVTKTGVVIHRGKLAGLRDDGERLYLRGSATRFAVAEALQLAAKRFGETLHIEGDAQFKRTVVSLVVARRLNVRFDDVTLEAQRVTQKEQTERANERPNNARKDVEQHTSARRATDPQTNSAQSAPREQDGLREMPESELVRDRGRPELLLPRDVRHHVSPPGGQTRDDLRRSADARGGLKRHADGRRPPPAARGRLRDISAIGMLGDTRASARAGELKRTPARRPSPPPAARGAMRPLSSVPTLDVGRIAARAATHGGAEQQQTGVTRAIAKYVAERQQKRDRGARDVLPHSAFDGRAGDFTFVGRRSMDGHTLLLLRASAEIFVASASGVPELSVGDRVSVNRSGALERKGRSR